MIAFIKGFVQSYGSDWLIVDHDGMGWKVSYAHTDKIHLNEEIMVYTYLHYTEAEMSLYGFESQEEMDLFLRLISVKGLGPRTAMNMLARASAEKIILAVESGDVTALKAMPGIGAKTAQRIIVDLHDKIAKSQSDEMPLGIQDGIQTGQIATEAITAMVTLGFPQAASQKVVQTILKEQEGLTVEAVIREALKRI